MAISPNSISSQSIQDNTNVVIDMLSAPPDLNEVLSPLDTPGKLYGFYNGVTGFVELYVIDKSGSRFLLC